MRQLIIFAVIITLFAFIAMLFISVPSEPEVPVGDDTTAVTLYYYDPSQDLDGEGNVLCSRQGLVSIARRVPKTDTMIRDTINLLLKGNLTQEERAEGITTEFPLEGFNLVGFSRVQGTLTLTFDDPNNRSSGGSCRAGILWAQIEKTAKQFSGVEEVHFFPEELFQP
ncbi:MAG: GerMN domain-containing protein [bacterium]|nr:GerMN domain-containing protein [bacterium]